MDDDLRESTRATLRHLVLLSERAAKIRRAHAEAEHQMLHRVGSAHRCGEITDDELHEFWDRYRALNTDRRSQRWNANIDFSWHHMTARVRIARQAARRARVFAPNGPEGTWIGSWPCGYDDPRPETGTSVVYVLFDDRNEPFYVGSTNSFRSRLSAHVKDGKPVSHWHAHPCRDRGHAYEVEDRLLKEHLPRLNRKASR